MLQRIRMAFSRLPHFKEVRMTDDQINILLARASRKMRRGMFDRKSVVLADGNTQLTDGELRYSIDEIFVDKISQNYFLSPDKDVQLQALPEFVLTELGKTNKPLVLKKNIVEKNKYHEDLTEKDIIQILGDAIYNCDLIIQPNPHTKPDYFLLVSKGSKNKQALLEISEGKNQYEVVNYHYLGERQLWQKIRRAEKQNGFVKNISRDGLPNSIITSKGAAGSFSALTTDGNNISQLSENANFTDGNGRERTETDGELRFAITPDVDTPAFKNWFQNSKVVDQDGKPLVVYHGTNGVFTKFKRTKNGYLGPGIYFVNDRKVAERYTDFGNEGIMAVYLKAENPLVIDGRSGDVGKAILEVLGKEHLYEKRKEAKNTYVDIVTSADIKALRNMGYDSIFWKVGNVTEYVVFEPTQIKSATDNVGTFDPENPDIRFSIADYSLDEQSDIIDILTPYIGTVVDKTPAEIAAFLKERGVDIPEHDAYSFAKEAARRKIKIVRKAADARRDNWLYENILEYKWAVDFAGSYNFKIRNSPRFEKIEKKGTFWAKSKDEGGNIISLEELAKHVSREYSMDEIDVEQKLFDFYKDLTKPELRKNYTKFRDEQLAGDRAAARAAFDEFMQQEKFRIEDEAVEVLTAGQPVTEEWKELSG